MKVTNDGLEALRWMVENPLKHIVETDTHFMRVNLQGEIQRYDPWMEGWVISYINSLFGPFTLTYVDDK